MKRNLEIEFELKKSGHFGVDKCVYQVDDYTCENGVLSMWNNDSRFNRLHIPLSNILWIVVRDKSDK